MATLIAHSLCGAACLELVRALRGRDHVEFSPATLLLAASAACLPDLDLIPSHLLTGNLALMHGGPTHSLAFALLAGAVTYAALRKTARKFDLALVVALAVTSHVLIDLATGPKLGLARSHGTPLFWPLDSERLRLPVTLFMGVKHGSVSIWFTWVNVRVALLELALFAPPVLLALALGRKRPVPTRHVDFRRS